MRMRIGRMMLRMIGRRWRMRMTIRLEEGLAVLLLMTRPPIDFECLRH